MLCMVYFCCCHRRFFRVYELIEKENDENEDEKDANERAWCSVVLWSWLRERGEWFRFGYVIIHSFLFRFSCGRRQINKQSKEMWESRSWNEIENENENKTHKKTKAPKFSEVYFRWLFLVRFSRFMPLNAWIVEVITLFSVGFTVDVDV